MSNNGCTRVVILVVHAFHLRRILVTTYSNQSRGFATDPIIRTNHMDSVGHKVPVIAWLVVAYLQEFLEPGIFPLFSNIRIITYLLVKQQKWRNQSTFF